jgi:hypothetical protein
MWCIFLSALCLSLSPGLREATTADEKVEQRKARLQAVRQKIADLQQQEQVLRRQLGQTEEKPAEMQEEYIKLEVRGILSQEHFGRGVGGAKFWLVSAAGSRWSLDFGKNKDFLALAKLQMDRAVIVTGQLLIQNTPRAFSGREPVLVVGTFKAAGK